MLNFNSRGVSAAGFHPCTLADIEANFVNRFLTSITRNDILVGYTSFINKLKQYGVKCEQWIDGSFVTSNINPNDIDLVCIIDKVILDNLSDLAQQELGELLNPSIAKAKYKCDAYLFVKVADTGRFWYCRVIKKNHNYNIVG